MWKHALLNGHLSDKAKKKSKPLTNKPNQTKQPSEKVSKLFEARKQIFCFQRIMNSFGPE